MNSLCLLPPILVLVVALRTKNVLLSLGIGLGAAVLIASHFCIEEVSRIAFSTLDNTLDIFQIGKRGFPSLSSNWSIFAFIFSVGIITAFLSNSGATQAFAALIEKKVKTKKGVEQVSILLSFLFFIDDYFSSLSIGSLMHPITDRYQIARAKLAFLIDSMAAPLAILCPFSTWIGVVIGFLNNNGVSSDLSTQPLIYSSPFSAFVQLIPFIFYSFIMILSSWFIVSRRISFGTMKEHELKALEIKPIPKTYQKALQKKEGGLFDFFALWLGLVTSLIGSMLYCGSWSFFGGNRDFLEAMQNSCITTALLFASISSLSFAFSLLLFRNIFPLRAFPKLILEGIQSMKSAIFILILAWSMGSILRHELQIGEFISSHLLSFVSPSFFPLSVFLVALSIAFATGSSWGTAALLFPMVVPVTVSFSQSMSPATIEATPIFLPAIGALLSGCVAGDHISPISDTTLMTSLSTRMKHLDHVRTQFDYAFPCIGGTTLAFALYGFISELPVLTTSLLCLTGGLLFSFGSLVILNRGYVLQESS